MSFLVKFLQTLVKDHHLDPFSLKKKNLNLNQSKKRTDADLGV